MSEQLIQLYSRVDDKEETVIDVNDVSGNTDSKEENVSESIIESRGFRGFLSHLKDEWKAGWNSVDNECVYTEDETEPCEGEGHEEHEVVEVEVTTVTAKVARVVSLSYKAVVRYALEFKDILSCVPAAFSEFADLMGWKSWKFFVPVVGGFLSAVALFAVGVAVPTFLIAAELMNVAWFSYFLGWNITRGFYLRKEMSTV